MERYMGQIHAECDCPIPEKCIDRCMAAVKLLPVDARDHIRNILRRLKEEIKENKPVNAFEWVKTLEEALKKQGVLYD